MTLTFNGVSKPFFHATVDTKRPMWAPIEWDMVEIPGRPGAYLKHKKIKARQLSVPVVIKGIDDMQKAKEEVAEWLVTDEPAPLVFTDEPDRTYYAVIDGEGQLDEVFKYGKGTINFICPDPYKYGAEKSFDISNQADGVNLVKNGDFSNGLTDWRNWMTADGNQRGVKTDLDFDGDDYKFTNGFYYTTTVTGQYGYAQDDVTVKEGQTYILSAWVKVLGGNGKVGLQEGNGKNGYTKTKYDAELLKGKWTKIIHKFKAKSNATNIYVGQLNDNDNQGHNNSYFTGVSLKIDTGEDQQWSPYNVVTVKNDGSAPTSPIVNCTLTDAATAYSIELLNNDSSVSQGVYLKFNFIAGDKLTIDFAKRTAFVNGEKKNGAVLIKSDFFDIPPKNAKVKASHPSELRFTEKYK